MPSPSLPGLIAERIRARGPITVAEFMDLALYHPSEGYYTSAAQRSGRAGDFFTSVDLGPVFGALLAEQIAECWQLAGAPDGFDLVEAGAGNGRLARDVLEAARLEHPSCYHALRLSLVEASPAARAAQPATLGTHLEKLASSGETMPAEVTGVIVANELLDALPVHRVVMREGGLRERYVAMRGDALVEVEGPLSTPALADYLGRVGATLEPGWIAEVNLAADAWVRQAARSLARGFLVIIDYGHEAAELYSATHASGTLRAFRAHTTPASPIAWLADPGEADLTAHVDLTGVQLAAEAEGLTTLARLDQTYFVLGLGIVDRVLRETGDPLADLKRRLAMKTLLMPGGLGSTHKVLIFGRAVGTPSLACAAFGQRVT